MVSCATAAWPEPPPPKAAGEATKRRRAPTGRGASERVTAGRPAATGTGTAAARAPQRPAPRLRPVGRVRAKAMKTRVRPLPDAGRHAERGRGGVEHRQGRHHRLGQARVQDRGRRRRITDRLRNSSCDALAWRHGAARHRLAPFLLTTHLAVTHAPSVRSESRVRGGTWGWRSMRYETSVDVVSRHVLIAALRRDAHRIPAAPPPQWSMTAG